ncbi:MAG TPA: RcpC/CpaB family pilus assembly protein [Flexivirga sp.]|uniref:Flp pilus assembly protein CpaB n=1 Tax=Flexivirga sp. TaxID=1962927 RepID=UPI002D1A9757|nr:RcpC/CpaB family pilus assembly protein [Flexivirga sp.]HWC22244.1 RcpC/CpaB family pilus assembly protein [Flexivirga sp.]
MGALLVVSYVNGADARAVDAQNPVTAYVVKKVVPAGTTLADAQSQGLIKATKVAQTGRPAGVLSVVDASNRTLVATTDIQPGEFVMSARFGAKQAGEKAIAVPDGKVAISVQLTAPERVANFITPGSHIVVYATAGIKSAGTDEKAKAFNQLDVKGTNVLLADVEVIAFGSTPLQNPSADNSSDNADKKSSNDGSSQNDSAYLVTVSVTPNESVKLVHSVNQYTLYAGLLGSGTKVDPQGEIDDGNVFGGNSVLGNGTLAGAK